MCLDAGIEVFPIPGPSSLSAALAVCGFDAPFLFIGFLPKKVGQLTKTLKAAAEAGNNLVFFEATFRLEKTLKFLAENYPQTLLFVGKEMTKKFESYEVGYAEDFLEKIKENKSFTKGEFVVIANFAQ